MPKQVYICDKCGRSFTTEESAAYCESRHVCPGTIIGFSYAATSDVQKGMFPSQLTVEFDMSDAVMNHNEIAVYRLECVGPKPV